MDGQYIHISEALVCRKNKTKTFLLQLVVRCMGCDDVNKSFIVFASVFVQHLLWGGVAFVSKQSDPL